MIDSFTGEYEFLSNFYQCPFEAPWYWNYMIQIQGLEPPKLVWDTNEHYFQAAKARERSQALTIQGLRTPGRAKQRGRQIRLVDGWDKHKINVMLTGLRLKFANPECGDLLRGTWPHRLVEGNQWGDDYWGATWTGIDDMRRRVAMKGEIAWSGPRIGNRPILVGHNWLGRLLEVVREELR